MTLEAVQIIRKARELITPEGAWTQGTFARDAKGDPVGLFRDGAVCFCLGGALDRAEYIIDADVPGRVAYNTMMQVVGASRDGACGIASWNDVPGRNQYEVLAALKLAEDVAARAGELVPV